MRLSQEQRDQLITRLNTMGANRPCEMCLNTEWHISDVVFELREFNQGGLSFLVGDSPIYPAIILACSRCGNTKIFSAIALGIVEPPKPLQQAGGQK